MRLAVRRSFGLMYRARKFVQNFTALAVVICAALIVSVLNVRVYASTDSFAFGLWKSQPTYVKTNIAPVATRNLALAPVSEATRIGEVDKSVTNIAQIDGGTVIAPGSARLADNYSNDTTPVAHVIMYTVRRGDTVSTIAKSHGVTIDTITWENEISDVDAIKPGDVLRVLAVSGLRHRIAKNDTIKKIAENYSVDAAAIIAFNELPANGQLEAGQEIVIPGGKKPEVKIELPQRTIALGARRSYTKIKRGWLTHPAPGARKTQWLHPTNAVDLAAPIGTPIYAAAAGTVITATSGGWGGGYGKYIKIKHKNGVITLYAHLWRTKVKKGQKVKQGQIIGLMGSTGRSTGSHVHFEVRGARNPF